MFQKVLSKNIECFSKKYRAINLGKVTSAKKDGFPFFLKPTKKEYVSRSRNSIHAYEMNLMKKQLGDNHWSRRMPEKRYTKLSNKDVLEIKKDNRLTSSRKLAAKYGVTKATILAILKGKIWKHL